MKLKTIRILETIFLMLFSFQIETYPKVVFGFKIHLGLFLDIFVGLSEEGGVLSTLFFGYLLSFVGTLQQKARVRKGLWTTSMALSLLGMISYINEFVRVIAAYEFSFMFHIPLVLVILDWVMFKKDTSRSLVISEKALGPEHPDVATSLNNLALLYYNQGKYADAEPLYKRALAIKEKALGPEHPSVATSLNNLAALYRVQGRYAEAEPLHKRALAIREKALGPDHPYVATSLNNLALLYDDQGKYTEAEPLYKRALAIWEKALGAEHPEVANSLNNLAGLYDTQGRYAEAEPLHQRALAIREKALGPDHPHVAQSLENYAALLRKTGRGTEATKMEARAKAIRAKHAKENPAK